MLWVEPRMIWWKMRAGLLPTVLVLNHETWCFAAALLKLSTSLCRVLQHSMQTPAGILSVQPLNIVQCWRFAMRWKHKAGK
jgi:hypothetical protein